MKRADPNSRADKVCPCGGIRNWWQTRCDCGTGIHWPVGKGDCLDDLHACKKYRCQQGRWRRANRVAKAEASEGKTRLVQKFCLKTVEKVAEARGIRASEAVEHIVEKVGENRKGAEIGRMVGKSGGEQVRYFKAKNKRGA